MKNSLPRWSAAAVLLLASAATAEKRSAAATQAAPAAAVTVGAHDATSLSAGDRLLVQALNQLERRRSVTARLAYEINFRGERLTGRGSYWQQGSGEDLRLRLDLHIVDPDSSLTQVCNSRELWIDLKLPIGRTVSQINLRQLRANSMLAGNALHDIRPGEASWSPTQPDLLACHGGLPRLLARLGENFSFMPPQAMRLVSPGAQPQTSAPYFAVVGHWKPDKLGTLLGSQEPSLQSPPSGHVPDEVLLLFGQTDLFPYRVEYRPRETFAPADPKRPAKTYRLSSRPMVVLEFSEVTFDVPIAAGQFEYKPGNVDWIDQTAAVIERLQREREAKIATRTVESQPQAPAR